MSVVSPQDRLAGAWNLSTAHSAITFSVSYVVASFRTCRALSDDVELTADLEFVRAA
jgi:hypothetical protein